MCLCGLLLGRGSDVRPGCSTAERAFGSREEKDCVGMLLVSAACIESEDFA